MLGRGGRVVPTVAELGSEVAEIRAPSRRNSRPVPLPGLPEKVGTLPCNTSVLCLLMKDTIGPVYGGGDSPRSSLGQGGTQADTHLGSQRAPRPSGGTREVAAWGGLGTLLLSVSFPIDGMDGHLFLKQFNCRSNLTTKEEKR